MMTLVSTNLHVRWGSLSHNQTAERHSIDILEKNLNFSINNTEREHEQFILFMGPFISIWK